MQPLLIDFFGDLSCPWCHLGWRRLRQAMRWRPNQAVEVRWQPFQLNPDIPVTGIDRADYMLRKFGNLERVHEVQTAIDAAMRADNIAINLERVRVTPHTGLAHRLMRLAAAENRLDEAMTGFFMACFIEGRNLGDPRVVTEVGAMAGLSPDRVADLLNDHAPAHDSRASEAAARQLGVKAVPYFLFNGQYSLAGAHDPVAFLPLLDLCGLSPPVAAVSDAG